jgi:putative membrane protein
LWALVAVYAGARVLQSFPDRVPMLAIVAAHVLPAALFAFVHGRLRYGTRGILVFFFICLAVGNAFENLSIATGFPFGRYHFTDVMGPKVLQVPVLLGMAYIGIGYVSWTLAAIILGKHAILATAAVSAFLMVAWDLATEPVWATVVRGWIWHDGGPYFGVPLTNFLGWYFTVFVIYALFGLYLRGRKLVHQPLPTAYWRMAVLFYGIAAAGNLLVIPRTGLHLVTDATGAAWRVTDILGTSAAVSIFGMGALAAVAWFRLADH